MFAPSLWPVDVELVVVVVVAKDPVGVGVGLIVFVFVFVFVTGAPLEVGDPVGAGPMVGSVKGILGGSGSELIVPGPIGVTCP